MFHDVLRLSELVLVEARQEHGGVMKSEILQGPYGILRSQHLRDLELYMVLSPFRGVKGVL